MTAMQAETIRRYRREVIFDLMPRSLLSSVERDAVDAVLLEQKKSTNPKWRVGVAAIAENDKIIAVHNSKNGPGHHAEQTAVSYFYKLMPVGQKKLKALVVAGAQFDDEVIRCNCPYHGVPFEQVK